MDDQLEVFAKYDIFIQRYADASIKMAQTQLTTLKYLQQAVNDIEALQSRIDLLEQQLETIKYVVLGRGSK